MRLSREYYRIAPYHHDSAASRMYSIKLHERLRAEGLVSAMREVLPWRDGLEPAVRLLVFPRSLAWFHGHLVAAVPLMALFLGLVVGYVWRMSGSPWLGVSAALLVWPFAFVHDPIWGLTDYWRESVATWLLGSALLAWLLSNGLERPRWAALAGVLLGALVAARTVAAVYASVLFGPSLLALLWRGRRGGPGPGRAGLGAFLSPIALAAVVTAALSGRRLYTHYFVTGWSYGTPLTAARHYLAIVPSQLGLGLAATAIALALAFVAGRARLTRGRLQLVWWAVGLPIAMVAAGTLYHSLSALETPILVVTAAVVLGQVDPRRTSALAAILAVLALGGTVAQRERTRNAALARARAQAASRTFYLQLAGEVLSGAPAQRYGLLFEAWDTHFWNYAFYDFGVAPTGTVAYHTVADSYYRHAFPGASARQIARANAARLEAEVGTLAVAHCAPGAITEASGYGPFAREVAARTARRLRASPRWRARRRFDSPYGCLFVYEWTAADLPPAEKWRAVRAVTDAP